MRGKQLLHVGRHAVVWPVVPGKDAPPRQRCEVLVQVGKKHRFDVAELAMGLFETRVPRNLRELPGNREFTGCRQSEVTLGFPGLFSSRAFDENPEKPIRAARASHGGIVTLF